MFVYLRWLLSHCSGRGRSYRQNPCGPQCEHMVTVNETREMRSGWGVQGRNNFVYQLRMFVIKEKLRVRGQGHWSPQCPNHPDYHTPCPSKILGTHSCRLMTLGHTLHKTWLYYLGLVFWSRWLLYFWMLLHLYAVDFLLPQCLKNMQ